MAFLSKHYIFGDILKKREERQRKKSSQITIRCSKCKSLPECLVYEILSWLPVKPLLRFKVVCKSWCAMIESGSFISMHLKHQYSRDDCREHCVIVIDRVLPNELQPLAIMFNERYNHVISIETLDWNPPYNHHMCGPCDGIYYLWDTCSFKGEGRYLWNPTLNELKVLPPIVITNPNLLPNLGYSGLEFYGLGFDPVTEDYKVVIVRALLDKTIENGYFHMVMDVPPSVFVFSLKSNSWRYVTDLPKPYMLNDNVSYIFVNTSLYWLASTDRNPVIYTVMIVFNLATEKCQDIQLPDSRNHNRRRDECLMIYHNDIAYVVVDNVNKSLDVWSLVEGCWRKKLIVELDIYVRSPVGHLGDGLLMFEGMHVPITILCNLDTQEILKVRHTCFNWGYGNVSICSFKESLVPLGVKHIDRQWSNILV